MNIKKKKFFPITLSVWGKSTAAMLCMFCLVLQVNAQNDRYHPLVQEGKVWSVVYVDVLGGIQNLKFTTTQMMFFGDTTINDVLYKKMYATTKEFPQFPQDWTLQNFMREDENKKVWYKRINSGMEELYYDFSLEVGDTLPINLGYVTPIPETIIVEDITYKTMQNGDIHKVLHLSIMYGGYFGSGKEFWIEGVGSNLGVLFPVSGTLLGELHRLLCVYENEELIYSDNPWLGICYKSGSTGIKDYDKNQIYIYPNPASNQLRISLPNSSEGGANTAKNIEIYDIVGQVVMTTPKPSKTSATLSFQGGESPLSFGEGQGVRLDVSHLANGMYFLKIGNKTVKFVKE